MRAFLPLSILLLASACGQESRQPSARTDSMPVSNSADASAEESAGPPGIGVTAAPGVAFNYRYNFRLPADRVGQVQEQHAAACEKLGIDRCRITGMVYRLINDRDREAMLAFKLDPAIARQFGKDGIEAVTRAEGMLTESEITGEDAGSEIAAATRTVGQLEEDLRKIEEQLARAGPRSSDRTELQVQAAQLRESIRSTRTTRAERQESLARTPVVFRYGSGDLAPGSDRGSQIGKALRQSGDNLGNAFAVMIVVLIFLAPWLLLAGLGWWALRLLRRRLGRAGSAPAPAED
jgi:hypothetical protein